MKEDNILRQLESEIKDVLSGFDSEIIELSLKPTGNSISLRILADKKQLGESIRIDECAAINRRIGDIIEEKNLMDQRYILEVSSPGLDRLLKTQRDFQRAVGDAVDIWVSEAPEGRNYLDGVVKEAQEQQVIIKDNKDIDIVIQYRNIAKAKRKL